MARWMPGYQHPPMLSIFERSLYISGLSIGLIASSSLSGWNIQVRSRLIDVSSTLASDVSNISSPTQVEY